MEISVIICTYNPVLNYINRVIESLSKQTLDKNLWELIIVNNNSNNGFESQVNLSWHSQSKVVVESKQGLTHSRVRGIKEAVGSLLVFVDDDNILNPDYLEVALRLSKEWPHLGVWGGNIAPEFETPPEDWTKDYWYYLALRTTDKDYWSNDISASKAEPCGAGLCVRRSICLSYIEELSKHPLRLQLGRTGKKLISGEDTDIVLTALQNGFGMGVFRDLRITHIMPAGRLTESYLLRLMEGLKYSHVVLGYLRDKKHIVPPRTLKWHLHNLYTMARLQKRDKKFYLAKLKAEKEALNFIKELSE